MSHNIGCGRRYFLGAAMAAFGIPGECGGGLLLALGLFQPAAAAPIISVMIAAIATVHWGNGLLAPLGQAFSAAL